ncbi:SDR family NAD(P)-dependent oxidoreductase [Pseudomonas taiwanensis]|uniref:SDR family oxidoreductase n=1 Tax=Pseudomonas taiwanensis TaxID=470150 RepID=A0ABR6V5V3_9PSED|nr:SDR family oxidoreductase [Pseudomonas taiwanensis]MBC3475625.1 SDR family oxidoreductase [Pseudomonas taiwanensis]
MRNSPVAIVTGGGTGIGAATASALITAGWNVVICGRRLEPLKKVAEETGAFPVVADTSSENDINQLVETTVERFGALDGLVLNAGIVRVGQVGVLSNTDWEDMVRTNLTGPFQLLRVAIPHLIAARGAIVGVGSAAALRATGEIPGYNATKAGLCMLMQSVAIDYGPQGVRANTVCPGWVRTEMADMELGEYGATLGLNREQAYTRATSFVPTRRPANASEVADVIAWLLSGKASYVNAAVIPVDGGMIAGDPGSIALDPRISVGNI